MMAGPVGQVNHVREIQAVAFAPPRVVIQVDGPELGTLVERAVLQCDQTVTRQPELGEVGQADEFVRFDVGQPAVAEVQRGQTGRVQAAR